MVRRLAAIVALDVVGYSRLMAIDEDEAWAAWSSLRALIEPPFVESGSRIVKSTGDGLLIESPSAVEAVKAAAAVQAIVTDWNRSRPEDRRMLLRVGVNVGDIIIAEDGDVYGDGVNLAARLEALAQPGGICLSDAAYRQVVGRVDQRFVSLGEQRLKNIPKPMAVWSIGPSPELAMPSERRRWLALSVSAVTVIAVVALLVRGDLDTTPDDILGVSPGPTIDATPTSEVTSNPGDADILWSVGFTSDISRLSAAPDASCSETACRGRLFVATTDGSLHGIELNGSETWPKPYESGDVTEMTATSDGVTFAVTGSRAIVALDGSRGEIDWRALAPFEATQDHPHIATSAEGLALTFGLGVALLDGSGTPVWAVPDVTRLTTEALSADGGLIAVSDGRWVYGLDAASGERRWEVGPTQIDTPVWLLAQEFEISSGTGRRFERRVWVTTSNDDLVLIDGTTGQTVWSYPVSAPPAISDLDVVHVLNVDHHPTAVDAHTGAVLWTAEHLAVDGDIVRANSIVYVLSGGELVAINARSGTELARLATGLVGAQLAAVDEVVLVTDGSTLFATRSRG